MIVFLRDSIPVLHPISKPQQFAGQWPASKIQNNTNVQFTVILRLLAHKGQFENDKYFDVI